MGVSKSDFKATKAPDYAEKEIKIKNGTYWRKTSFKLRDRSTSVQWFKDLANKVVHTSMIEGDGAGYDINLLMILEI